MLTIMLTFGLILVDCNNSDDDGDDPIIVNVNDWPLGDILVNNLSRGGTFTSSDRANSASRFFWFRKIADNVPSSGNYRINFYGENNPNLPNVDTSGINSSNLRITLRFYTAAGTVISGYSIGNGNSMLNSPYYYSVTRSDFNMRAAEYLSIEVENLAPGINNGNFGISWNSEIFVP